MASVYSSSVYLNHNLMQITPNTNACDKIGRIWARLKESREQYANSVGLMGELGVDRTDEQAQRILFPIIQQAVGDDVQVIPSEDDSGVFFLADGDGKKFAVFKVGEKRARMELLARSIAHRLGFEKHAIPGIACTIQNPVFPKSDEVQAELFNGNVKVYRSRGKKDYNAAVQEENEATGKPYTITGILEPFISGNPEISKEDFLKMVVYALIIGLRDGKLSGMAGSMLFDLEDCMPQRFLPESTPDRNVAATNLPLLEHPFAEELIPVEILAELSKKVSENAIPIFQLLADLGKERVEMADLAGETFIPVDDELYHGRRHERSFEDIGWDHGGCPVQVERPSQIMDQHPSINVESQATPLLTDKQLFACAERVSRLREALERQIRRKTPMTAIDLVCAVDPFYKAHWDALKRARYNRQPFTHIIGRHAPRVVGPLSEGEVAELRRAKRSSEGFVSFARPPLSSPPSFALESGEGLTSSEGEGVPPQAKRYVRSLFKEKTGEEDRKE
ncbi:MAG: hypothetical protein K1X28_00415 [Parachlamydiales bacterium]|nr:hypothetical protein [Parachlamydiales bacterium]